MRANSPSAHAARPRRDRARPRPLAWLGLPARELALVATVAATLGAAIVGFGAVALSHASAPAPAALSDQASAASAPPTSAAWPAPAWSADDGPAPTEPGRRPVPPPLTHLVSTAQEFPP